VRTNSAKRFPMDIPMDSGRQNGSLDACLPPLMLQTLPGVTKVCCTAVTLRSVSSLFIDTSTGPDLSESWSRFRRHSWKTLQHGYRVLRPSVQNCPVLSCRRWEDKFQRRENREALSRAAMRCAVAVCAGSSSSDRDRSRCTSIRWHPCCCWRRPENRTPSGSSTDRTPIN
jgi:hypothetical protein